ncbi:hypothetical protein H8A95_05125 [Bradyrhizobium sp. Pear76]|uniref:hypothetical protein n=1 Tax=Bradyrhizobium oropedii TaxID=1571201 RepID=UPI001E547CE3|nr:hypothetical protein [Bradyrhizobium oropedii]MCC8961717.1 hypothetical protein [Bradyrhizobium oropedii]
MNDNRNFIDDIRDMSRNRGQEKTTAEMLDDFKMFGPEKRADMLDQVDSEFRQMSVESDETSLRKYAEFTSFHTDMQDLHHKLRKAGR